MSTVFTSNYLPFQVLAVLLVVRLLVALEDLAPEPPLVRLEPLLVSLLVALLALVAAAVLLKRSDGRSAALGPAQQVVALALPGCR